MFELLFEDSLVTFFSSRWITLLCSLSSKRRTPSWLVQREWRAMRLFRRSATSRQDNHFDICSNFDKHFK